VTGVQTCARPISTASFIRHEPQSLRTSFGRPQRPATGEQVHLNSTTRSDHLMTATIQAHGLVKTYGRARALDGLDLSAEQGTVLALLGPNGAGKTTAVRVLTTLVKPDEGSAELAGIDVLTRPEQARRNLGLSGQYAAVDGYLTGFENLVMIGRLYGLRRAQARDRAAELLEQFSLTDAAGKPSKDYSG